MSEDAVGYGKPPKHTQFQKNRSGNPRGRPPKPKRRLLPRQLREDVLRLMEEDLMADTPKGRRKVNSTVLFLRSVQRRAISGNPTAMKLWMLLMTTALQDRLAENGPVRFLDQSLDNENRKRARLHEMMVDPDWDIEEVTKDIY